MVDIQLSETRGDRCHRQPADTNEIKAKQERTQNGTNFPRACQEGWSCKEKKSEAACSISCSKNKKEDIKEGKERQAAGQFELERSRSRQKETI